MRLQHKSFPTVDFKVLDEAQGLVEAYVSVFHVTDAANERVMPGFFSKSLETRLPKVVFAHDWNRPIGKTISGTEERHAGDSRLPVNLRQYGGLYCLMQLNLDVQDGKDTLSHLRFGSLDEFSFGYDVTRATNAKDGVRELHEGTTYEVSPVLVGCNPATQLVGVKDLPADLFDVPQSLADLCAVSDALYASKLCSILFEGHHSDEERSQQLEAAFSEFHQAGVASLKALMNAAGDEDARADLEAEYKQIFSVPARTAGRFDAQLLALLTEVEGAKTRAEGLIAIRKEQGRLPFSPERREQLKALSEALIRLVEITAPTPPLDLTLLQMKASARRRRLLALGDGAIPS
jgi:HK97 family phage prohead protease